MSNRARKTGFRWELTLGLALIILVLVILNIASHYAMFRLKDSLKATARDELSEASFVIAARLIDAGSPELSEDDRERISGEYSFTGLEVIHLNYDRALELREGDVTDTAFSSIDPEITAEELKPLLSQNDVFLHRSGELQIHYLHFVDIDGSSYILHLETENRILASLERAGRVLVFFGILGVVIIIFVSFAFIRKATRPITTLREKAESTGHYNADNLNEIEELIGSYEKIIADHKSNAAELIRLNRIIKDRADRLEAHNEYILRSIPTGIITLDMEGNVTSANYAVCRILGPVSENKENLHFENALGNYEQLCGHIREFINTGQALNNLELIVTGPDGERKVLVASITGLKDGQNNDIGLSILVNDMTELERLQKEIEAKNSMAMLGEMSGGLAHQLRNSMAAIVGLGRLIVKKTEPEHPAGKNAALVLKEAKEAESLVSRFLDFARPLELSSEPFDVIAMLSEVTATHSNKYDNINYHFKAESGPIMVDGDRLLLKQAVCNIVDNASRACPNEGQRQVKIEVLADNNFLHIDIYDNGSGIPDDIGDKIYAPFYSGSASGTGLGLPLARKIVLLHEGFLGYENNPEGGTVFRIALPCHAARHSNSSALFADKSIAS